MKDKLFPTDLPSNRWVEFRAMGFSEPVCGVIYRLDTPATNGMPLGGIDTGCIDIETSGLFGYCTIFNSHVPRRGPLNLPFLGLSVEGETWVLCDPSQLKGYEGTNPKEPLEPVLSELKLGGIKTPGEIHYWGHYPVADIEFELDGPVGVGVRAWSPFIPGDLISSMIPGAVFEVWLRNRSDGELKGTIAFSFPGPTPGEAGAERFKREEVRGKFRGVHVTAPKASYFLGVIGEGEARIGGELGPDGRAWAGVEDALPEATEGESGSSVAVDFSLSPGGTEVVRFLLTWHSPEWKAGGHPLAEGNSFTHMYAKYHKTALEAAEALAGKHSSLLRRILAWQGAIYTDESLPTWLRDSLINVLYMITEDGLWAQAEPPIPGWARPEDGLFGMIEDPRSCPQIECIPCSFYGNIPLVYLFPELALSTLRGYKGYQYPDGAPPWIFGGVTGGTPPIDFASPTRGYQFALNGVCYAVMVDRYWLVTGDDEILREFYPSVKNCTVWQMHLRPEYSLGDRVISMPTGNVGTEWFEAPEPGWAGMTTHVGGLHLAQLKIAERMAERVGDNGFAQLCREWIEAGSDSLETKMWTGSYYLNFWEPETGKRSDLIFGYQLDGEWVAKFHGLESVFRPDRVGRTLETIKRTNIALSRSGAVNYANPDGTPAQVGGYGTYSYFPQELLMLAMTYMYHGEVDFGLELARRCWENIVLKWRYTWDMPNIMRGDEDTGERVYGHDYYQVMMLWALPAAMKGEDLSGVCKPGGLVDRVIKGGR
jgi:uncharacterized protein (DUF608 family)